MTQHTNTHAHNTHMTQHTNTHDTTHKHTCTQHTQTHMHTTHKHSDQTGQQSPVSPSPSPTYDQDKVKSKPDDLVPDEEEDREDDEREDVEKDRGEDIRTPVATQPATSISQGPHLLKTTSQVRSNGQRCGWIGCFGAVSSH